MAVAVGLGATAATTGVGPITTVALTVWVLAAYWRVPARRGPVQRHLVPLGHAALLVVAATAALGLVSTVVHDEQQGAVVGVGAAAIAAALVRLVAVRRGGPARILLIGDARAVAGCLPRWRSARGVRVVGVVRVGAALAADGPDLADVPVWDSLAELPERVAAVIADTVVFVPGPELDGVAVRRAGWQLQDAAVNLVVLSALDGVLPERVTPCLLGGETVCELARPTRSAMVTALKHGTDAVCAAILLVFALPVIITAGLAVRLETKGPMLFRQTRVGVHGAPFTMYKMRTMVHGADETKHRLTDDNEMDGVLFKMRRDPRVTRVGAWLRASSIDELPQLFNVLRGEMSLIGPRPFLPSETAEMSSDALRRLAVRPGMTGLWQVSGRSDLAWEESVALDTLYVDNGGLRTDLRIAASTVAAVVRRRGAY